MLTNQNSDVLQSRLVKLRPRLFNFASWQLGDKHIAEDITQNALLAAFENFSKFNSSASIETWVFSILKNKIVDYYRSANNKRSTNFSSLFDSDDESGNFFDSYFSSDGHWVEEIENSSWSNPEKALENKQFWLVLDVCINQLPEKMAQVFTMRVILELEVDEICKICEITQANYWKILSRSRIGLQQCLAYHWFGGSK